MDEATVGRHRPPPTLPIVVALALRSVARRAGPGALHRHWPVAPTGLPPSCASPASPSASPTLGSRPLRTAGARAGGRWARVGELVIDVDGDGAEQADACRWSPGRCGRAAAHRRAGL